MKSKEIEMISRGSNSRVMAYGSGQQRVAIKMVSSVNKKECQMLKNQYKILNMLQHPNIVRVYKLKELLIDEGNEQLNQLRHRQIALVLEFANRGNLLQILQKQIIPLPTLKSLIRDVAKSLDYLHSKNIAHRDIKLENILIFQKQQALFAKISDLGLSSLIVFKNNRFIFNEFRGTQRYMAPEIFNAKINKENGYDAIKTDLFAFGVVLFAAIMKKLPFERAIESDCLYILIIQRNYDKFWECHQIPKQFVESTMEEIQQFKSLFESLVSHDAKLRPSMNEILAHPFLARQL